MIPEPVAMATRTPQSDDTRESDPVSPDYTAAAEPATGVAASPNRIQVPLRIHAALKAAHEDAAEARLPDRQWQQSTGTVKALAGPPLVIDRMEELNSNQLLENDSLGG